MGFETDAIWKGQKPVISETSFGDVTIPIHVSSNFARKKVFELPGGYEYSRCGNPTRNAYETCLASLEHGKFGLSTSSGLAAVTVVSLLLENGDNIVSFEDIYGGTIRIFDDILPTKGITTTYFDATKPETIKEAIKDNTKLVWLESPTNPLLRVCDIKKIVDIVKGINKDILVAVDNTFLSPYFQKPLDFGVDIVVHSTTKYVGGHSDLIGGAIITNDPELHEKLRVLHNAIGVNPSPFNDWLANRGLKTLAVRLEKHQQNALKIAKFLKEHPQVNEVFYPGLDDNPYKEISDKQTTGYGGIVSFKLKGTRDDAIKFVESTKIFALAESLGGTESLIEHPLTMSHSSVPEEKLNKLGVTDDVIRLSVGIETSEDLIADLKQAFNEIGGIE
jgi:cystathionine gamma-lyase